jgi:hypothetical protein
MFDSVIVQCPECGVNVVYQSKAGDCRLNRYTIFDAPIRVLADVSYPHFETCAHGHKVQIRLQHIATVTIARREPTEEELVDYGDAAYDDYFKPT